MNVNEKVTVGLVDNTPKYIQWRGRNYTITQIGLHHHFREGKTLYHVFSVISGTLFMRLKLDTENLQWRLDGINDWLED